MGPMVRLHCFLEDCLKKFDRNARVLSLSHGDFDGIAAQIVIGNVFSNVVYETAQFYTVDRKLSLIDYDQFDYVFVTDIHPDNADSLSSDKIIFIDHHPSAYHDPSRNRFVISDKNKCAAYLVKFFMEKLYGSEIDLSHLDDLILMANEYDIKTWDVLNVDREKNIHCRLINDLYINLYDESQFRDRFMTGNTTLNETELAYLSDRNVAFENIYDNLEIFDLDKINGCVVFCEEFVNEITEALRLRQGYRVVIIRNVPKGRASIRTNVPEANVGKILDDLKYGGGHKTAAGFFERDNDVFYKKVLAIEEAIYDLKIEGVNVI